MKAIAKSTEHMQSYPDDIWIVKGKIYALDRVIHEHEELYHFIDEQGDKHYLEIEDFDKYFERAER